MTIVVVMKEKLVANEKEVCLLKGSIPFCLNLSKMISRLFILLTETNNLSRRLRWMSRTGSSERRSDEDDETRSFDEPPTRQRVILSQVIH